MVKTRRELIEDCLNGNFFELNLMAVPVRHGFMIIDPNNPDLDKQIGIIKSVDSKISSSVYTGYIITVTGTGTTVYPPNTPWGQSQIEIAISKYKNYLKNKGGFHSDIVNLDGFKVLFVY
ncbi:hypothetical protein KKH36_01790 [Patescibacteria group bacterium]|nr:hypothetical protein [Patescibacteria group bacterium]